MAEELENLGTLSHELNMDELYRILIIGDPDTGKTCLQRCFAGAEFQDDILITSSFMSRYVKIDGVGIEVRVYDTAGSARFRTATSRHYRRASGIIITYSVTKQETFDNIPSWIEEARKFGRHNPRLMILGTGCDCRGKIVDYITARNFADEHQLSFFEVSAKDGTNVELAFMTLITESRQQLS